MLAPLLLTKDGWYKVCLFAEIVPLLNEQGVRHIPGGFYPETDRRKLCINKENGRVCKTKSSAGSPIQINFSTRVFCSLMVDRTT